MLRGALAAALTPLRRGGGEVDADAVEPYVDFLAAGGVDGVLALGTTGEGILLTRAERESVLELFTRAARGRLAVAVHCGAQSTADTVALAEHAVRAGADAVAVIAPPYFRLDERALLEHFAAAAAAAAPLPFYVYEFEAASGYAVPPPLLSALAERAPNLAGLKVSDAPFARVAPYLHEGLDVFVGAEALIDEALAAGCAGAVSGLAAAYPEAVAEVVARPTPDAARRLGDLRAAVERFPRHAALKRLVARRGVPLGEDVRAPLRPLTSEERQELDRWAASS